MAEPQPRDSLLAEKHSSNSPDSNLDSSEMEGETCKAIQDFETPDVPEKPASNAHVEAEIQGKKSDNLTLPTATESVGSPVHFDLFQSQRQLSKSFTLESAPGGSEFKPLSVSMYSQCLETTCPECGSHFEVSLGEGDPGNLLLDPYCPDSNLQTASDSPILDPKLGAAFARGSVARPASRSPPQDGEPISCSTPTKEQLFGGETSEHGPEESASSSMLENYKRLVSPLKDVLGSTAVPEQQHKGTVSSEEDEELAFPLVHEQESAVEGEDQNVASSQSEVDSAAEGTDGTKLQQVQFDRQEDASFEAEPVLQNVDEEQEEVNEAEKKKGLEELKTGSTAGSDDAEFQTSLTEKEGTFPVDQESLGICDAQTAEPCEPQSVNFFSEKLDVDELQCETAVGKSDEEGEMEDVMDDVEQGGPFPTGQEDLWREAEGDGLDSVGKQSTAVEEELVSRENCKEDGNQGFGPEKESQSIQDEQNVSRDGRKRLLFCQVAAQNHNGNGAEEFVQKLTWESLTNEPEEELEEDADQTGDEQKAECLASQKTSIYEKRQSDLEDKEQSHLDQKLKSGLVQFEDVQSGGLDSVRKSHNVLGTPQDDIQGTPQIDVQGTPQDDVQETPKDDIQGTPQIDVQETPKDDIQGTLQDDVQRTLQDDVQGTLQDDVQGTPQNNNQRTLQDDVQGTLQDDVQETPKDDIQGTQQDDVQGTPQNNTQGTLQDDVQETPKDDIQGTLQDDVQGTPQNNNQGTLQDDVQETPKDDIQGTLQDDFQGTTQGDVLGTPQNNIQGMLHDDVQGTPQDDIQGTPQIDVLGTPQGDVQGTSQNDAQGTSQNNIQGPLRNDIQGTLQGDVQGTPSGDSQGKPCVNTAGASHDEDLGICHEDQFSLHGEDQEKNATPLEAEEERNLDGKEETLLGEEQSIDEIVPDLQSEPIDGEQCQAEHPCPLAACRMDQAVPLEEEDRVTEVKKEESSEDERMLYDIDSGSAQDQEMALPEVQDHLEMDKDTPLGKEQMGNGEQWNGTLEDQGLHLTEEQEQSVDELQEVQSNDTLDQPPEDEQKQPVDELARTSPCDMQEQRLECTEEQPLDELRRDPSGKMSQPCETEQDQVIDKLLEALTHETFDQPSDYGQELAVHKEEAPPNETWDHLCEEEQKVLPEEQELPLCQDEARMDLGGSLNADDDQDVLVENELKEPQEIGNERSASGSMIDNSADAKDVPDFAQGLAEQIHGGEGASRTRGESFRHEMDLNMGKGAEPQGSQVDKIENALPKTCEGALVFLYIQRMESTGTKRKHSPSVEESHAKMLKPEHFHLKLLGSKDLGERSAQHEGPGEEDVALRDIQGQVKQLPQLNVDGADKDPVTRNKVAERSSAMEDSRQMASGIEDEEPEMEDGDRISQETRLSSTLNQEHVEGDVDVKVSLSDDLSVSLKGLQALDVTYGSEDLDLKHGSLSVDKPCVELSETESISDAETVKENEVPRPIKDGETGETPIAEVQQKMLASGPENGTDATDDGSRDAKMRCASLKTSKVPGFFDIGKQLTCRDILLCIATRGRPKEPWLCLLCDTECVSVLKWQEHIRSCHAVDEVTARKDFKWMAVYKALEEMHPGKVGICRCYLCNNFWERRNSAVLAHILFTHLAPLSASLCSCIQQMFDEGRVDVPKDARAEQPCRYCSFVSPSVFHAAEHFKRSHFARCFQEIYLQPQ